MTELVHLGLPAGVTLCRLDAAEDNFGVEDALVTCMVCAVRAWGPSVSGIKYLYPVRAEE